MWHLLEQRVSTQNQQDWIAKLLGHQFDIIYKLGKENRAANALSTVMEEGELQALSRPNWLDAEKLQQEMQKDLI